MTTKKKLRPSRGNISITGSSSFEKQMEAIGKTIARRFKIHLDIKVSPLLLPMGEKNQSRLVFCICDGDLELFKVKLMGEKFDLHFNEDSKRPCLRIWGLPIDFLAPNAEKIKSQWKDLFQITARVAGDGNLQLSVSSKDGGEGLINDFREEIKKDFPDLIIKDKQKPRRGKAVPGFVVIFKSAVLRKDVAEMTQENKDNSNRDRKDDNNLSDNHMKGGVPAEELIKLAVAYLPQDDRINFIKSLLPEGVGLYDEKNPLALDGGTAKVNSL